MTLENIVTKQNEENTNSKEKYQLNLFFDSFVSFVCSHPHPLLSPFYLRQDPFPIMTWGFVWWLSESNEVHVLNHEFGTL